MHVARRLHTRVVTYPCAALHLLRKIPFSGNPIFQKSHFSLGAELVPHLVLPQESYRETRGRTGGGEGGGVGGSIKKHRGVLWPHKSWYASLLPQVFVEDTFYSYLQCVSILSLLPQVFVENTFYSYLHMCINPIPPSTAIC